VAQVSASQVSAAQVSVAQVSASQVSAAQVSVAQVSVSQVSVAQVSAFSAYFVIQPLSVIFKDLLQLVESHGHWGGSSFTDSSA
jgi:hypothetical protein